MGTKRKHETSPSLRMSSDRIREETGDLFSASLSNSLAHCVSSDMHMGAGIAVRFKEKFGCVDQLLRQQKEPGEVAYLKDGPRYIFYLVTKPRYFDRPTEKTLQSCIREMRKMCKDFGVKKLAIPRIGCGLDGLDWSSVSEMIQEDLSNSGIQVTVYSLDTKSPRKVTPNLPRNSMPSSASLKSGDRLSSFRSGSAWKSGHEGKSYDSTDSERETPKRKRVDSAIVRSKHSPRRRSSDRSRDKFSPMKRTSSSKTRSTDRSRDKRSPEKNPLRRRSSDRSRDKYSPDNKMFSVSSHSGRGKCFPDNKTHQLGSQDMKKKLIKPAGDGMYESPLVKSTASRRINSSSSPNFKLEPPDDSSTSSSEAGESGNKRIVKLGSPSEHDTKLIVDEDCLENYNELDIPAANHMDMSSSQEHHKIDSDEELLDEIMSSPDRRELDASGPLKLKFCGAPQETGRSKRIFVGNRFAPVATMKGTLSQSLKGRLGSISKAPKVADRGTRVTQRLHRELGSDVQERTLRKRRVPISGTMYCDREEKQTSVKDRLSLGAYGREGKSISAKARLYLRAHDELSPKRLTEKTIRRSISTMKRSRVSLPSDEDDGADSGDAEEHYSSDRRSEENLRISGRIKRKDIREDPSSRKSVRKSHSKVKDCLQIERRVRAQTVRRGRSSRAENPLKNSSDRTNYCKARYKTTSTDESSDKTASKLSKKTLSSGICVVKK